MNYELIVFDMDGTLTLDALDFESLRAQLGLQLRHPILEWIDTLEPLKREAACDILHRHEAEASQKCLLRPGADALIQRLRRRGLKIALLSRNSQQSVETVLRRYPMVFDRVASRDQAPMKPHPDSIRKISRSLLVNMDKTLMVGDYIYDLQVAKNAGTDSVLLIEPEAQLPDFTRDATYLIRRLEDIEIMLDSPELFRCSEMKIGGVQ